MRWIAVNYLFSPCSQYSYKKEASLPWFEPVTSFMPSSAHSTSPNLTYFCDISSEFKLDWVNVGKWMRWIFVGNAVNFAVNFCKKCGEKRWIIFFTAFTAFTAFLTLICHKSGCGEFLYEMRWIFVRNAVKCGEIFIFTSFTAFTAFLTKMRPKTKGI